MDTEKAPFSQLKSQLFGPKSQSFCWKVPFQRSYFLSEFSPWPLVLSPPYPSPPRQRWAKWRPPSFDIYLDLLPNRSSDTAFVFKKGRTGRLMLTTLDLWEGRGRGHDFCLRFFKKVRSFTPSDFRSGIRSLSTDLQVSMPTSAPRSILQNNCPSHLLLFLFASIGKLFPEPELWILIYLLRHTFTPPPPPTHTPRHIQHAFTTSIY
jgi:hypothetical protein